VGRLVAVVGGRALLACMATLVILAACTTTEQGGSKDGSQADVQINAVDPALQIGFDSACELVKNAEQDPIKFPGQATAGHMHAFFCTDIQPDSTVAQLRQMGTNSNRDTDTAAYWVRALERPDGRLIDPVGFKAYYRTQVPPDQLTPMPAGLKMIFGNAAAIEAQPFAVTSWNCRNMQTGQVTGSWAEPYECESPDARPRLKVIGPQCWNGKDLDSTDHMSHVAYPIKRDGQWTCPDSHPKAFIRPGLQISYPSDAEAEDPVNYETATLGDGGRHSAHADFMNGWILQGPGGLRALEANCFKGSGEFCGLGDQPR
jgi:Domain of unknown function (DUF1996)